MFDHTDASFAANLERAIVRILSGDDETPGLYRAVFAAQNWDGVLLVKGQVQAYENVLNEMRDVARRMSGEQQERNQANRSVN